MVDTRGSPLDRRLQEIREDGLAVPVDFDDLERAALEALPDGVADYTRAGAGTEATRQANRAGFDDWRIRPRVGRDIADRSLQVELFGRTLPTPLLLAPIGGQSLYHEEGEMATARAAAALEVPFALSTVASHTIESIADEMGDAPRLFQLYWYEDWDLVGRLVSRADDAGYDAILVTLDYQIPRWVPRNLDRPGHDLDFTPANLAADPALDDDSGPLDRDASVTWADLAFLREHTDLPIYVKGVLHPEDARLAAEHADGVVVSNHGGRQVDRAVGAISALPEVVDAVDADVPVLFDSGIRGGADALVALALGADAVFLGRPYVYALALAGERGVYETVHNALAELDSVLGLAGHDDVTAVDRTALRRETS